MLKLLTKNHFTFKLYCALWISQMTDFVDDDADDDDDDDDDNELFLWYGWPTKGVKPYFQPGPLSEILTIANLWQAASRTWTCAEPEFRLYWIKLYSSDNHYTTECIL